MLTDDARRTTHDARRRTPESQPHHNSSPWHFVSGELKNEHTSISVKNNLLGVIFSSPDTKCQGELLWGGWVRRLSSSVVCRLSCVVCRVSSVVNIFFKWHLLQNCWPEFHETFTEASLGDGEQTIQNGILILAFVWLPWQPKEKT